MYLERLTYDQACRRLDCRRNTEFISIGCTPCDEQCTQVSDVYEVKDMIAESMALAKQLIRMHGEPPEGAEFFIMKNCHEFGTYYDLGIFYQMKGEEDDAPDSPSEEYAMKCESLPNKWDGFAAADLRELGHSKFQPAKVIPLKRTA